MSLVLNNYRVDYLDVVKGVCIIWMVLYHIAPEYAICDLTKSAFMPLFFLISGMFFKDSYDFNVFVQKKVSTILIPFTFFYLISYVVYYLLKYACPSLLITHANGILDVFNQRVLFNGPIWFLLSLFFVNVLLFFICKISDLKLVRLLFCILFGVLGFYLGCYEMRLPLFIDVAFSALPFFFFGFLLKNLMIVHHIEKYYYIKYIILLIVLSGTLVFVHSNHNIGFGMRDNSGSATNLVEYFGLILAETCGALFTILLFKYIKRIPIISYAGRYSIIILCLHHLIYRPVKVILQQILHFENAVLSWSTFAVTLTLCLALVPLLVKFFPYVTAQKDIFLAWNDKFNSQGSVAK